jgi:hypothetical protein
MGAPNGSVVATPHEYLGSPVFMTHNAKIGDANGAGVVQLCPNLVTEEWTQVDPRNRRRLSRRPSSEKSQTPPIIMS